MMARRGFMRHDAAPAPPRRLRSLPQTRWIIDGLDTMMTTMTGAR